MGEEFFSRIKKLVRRDGKVIILSENDDNALVVMPLADYEDLTEDLCGEECECGKLDEEIFVGDPELGRGAEEKNEEVDKELIRKVNEDIAKWREEQKQKEEALPPIEDFTDGKKKADLVDLSEVAGSPPHQPDETGWCGGRPEAKEDVLTEEERYYLEPLE